MSSSSNEPQNGVLHLRIAASIKEMIIQEQMQPGDRLPTERDLMKRFGVSRSTMREAIKLLRAENVVYSRQGSGTFISDATGIGEDPLGLHFADQDTLLLDLLETRLVIEPSIAMLAAQRATDEELAQLAAIVDELEQADFTSPSIVPLDIRFHTAIAECTHNDVLTRVVPIIIESIQKGSAKTTHNPQSFALAKIAHRHILEALLARNVVDARYRLEQHIRETMEAIPGFSAKGQPRGRDN